VGPKEPCISWGPGFPPPGYLAMLQLARRRYSPRYLAAVMRPLAMSTVAACL